MQNKQNLLLLLLLLYKNPKRCERNNNKKGKFFLKTPTAFINTNFMT